MPGNLLTASTSHVLPASLCTYFVSTRVYPMLTNEYKDGRVERGIIVDGVNNPASIRTWRLSKRLTPTAWGTLRSFLESRAGGLPFYFYDPQEHAPGQPVGSNHDPTGVSTQGRYTVFARGGVVQTVGMARVETSIELVEIA